MLSWTSRLLTKARTQWRHSSHFDFQFCCLIFEDLTCVSFLLEKSFLFVDLLNCGIAFEVFSAALCSFEVTALCFTESEINMKFRKMREEKTDNMNCGSLCLQLRG